MSVVLTSKAVADTNILLYCFDKTDRSKHDRAVRLLEDLLNNDRLLLSVQILNEFYWNVTRPKRGIQVPSETARGFVQKVIDAADIAPMTTSMSLLAMECASSHQLQLWDALIWAAAKQNGAEVVFSEDYQHGRELDGVRFINPFLEK